EVVAAELDLDLVGGENRARELAGLPELDDAVVRREDEIVLDERPRAVHLRPLHAHDRVLGGGERDGRREEAWWRGFVALGVGGGVEGDLRLLEELEAAATRGGGER